MATLYPRASTPVTPMASPLASDFPGVPYAAHAGGDAATAAAAAPLRLSIVRSSSVSNAHEPTPVSPMVSRSGSISSYSTASQWTNQIPTTAVNVYPPPAYVAGFGASQVVSERKRRFSDDDDDAERARTAMSSREDMHFSHAALSLLNGFLDHMLYSVLAQARSTTLTALRPAVREVLKSRLATEAIASAEEELLELLAGGEDEENEMNQKQTVAEQNRKWDTELVWKRTRLRVMVYIRLGEMEDEDEERYVREDGLFRDGDRRFSHSSGLVPWAAAIFLTSVVEYTAEQVLQVAAQAADSRSRRQNKKPRVTTLSGMATPDGVTVEDHDMEKVAVNAMLGRLWRTWRKSLRINNSNIASPTTPPPIQSFSRRFSRDAAGGALSPTRSTMTDSRQPSEMAIDQGTTVADEAPEPEYLEHVLAANIPLPLRGEKRDVDEIEIPGLARDPDGEGGPVPQHLVLDFASHIALPIENEKQDVDEIEIPGLAKDPDATASSEDREPSAPKRRNSWTPISALRSLIDPVIGGMTTMFVATDDEPVENGKKPAFTRQRSRSVPTLAKYVPIELEDASDDEDTMEFVEAREDPVDAEEDDRSSDVTQVPARETEGGLADSQEFTEEAAASKEGVTEKEMAREDNSHPADSAEAVPPREIVAEKEQVQKDVLPPADSAEAAEAALAVVYGSRLDKQRAKKSLPALETTIEERDLQKNLIDMKQRRVPQTSQTQVAKGSFKESQPAASGPATVINTKASVESFSLDDGRHGEMPEQPIATPRHSSMGFREIHQSGDEGVANIGVAQTSDDVVSAVPEEPPTGYRQNRDSFIHPVPRRQSRLILDGSVPDSPSGGVSPIDPDEASSSTTPQSFLENRSLSVSRKSQQLEAPKARSPHEQARSPARSPNRASAPPNALSTSNDTNGTQLYNGEKAPSPWRQSLSAATEKTASWVASPKKSTPEAPSDVAVQEHPVVQKMANKMRNDITAKKEDEPLTSASIKGPQDFEMFVQGGDTVKYTLTPENVRDDPSASDAVPLPKSSRSLERSRSATQRQSPPAEAEARAGRNQTSKHATSAETDDEAERRRQQNKDKRRSISRPPTRNTTVHRKSGLIAREPQVQTQSTFDLADFIMSTGPQKEQETVQIRAGRSTTSLLSMRRLSRSSSPGASSTRRFSMGRFGAQSQTNVPPVPPMPMGSRNRQPRDATLTADGGTSELIDFIRTGSGEGGAPRQHRISRTIAPFRTTMDSDQLAEWGDRIAAQPDLKLNTNITHGGGVRSASAAPEKSFSHRFSPNSHQGPISPIETMHPAHSGQPQRLSSIVSPMSHKSSTNTSEPAQKRHQRKDAYANDLADENDDLLTALPKGRRAEESIIDFLKTSSPDSNEPHALTATPTYHPPRRSSAPATNVANRRDSSGALPARPVINTMTLPKNTTTSVAIGPLSRPTKQKLEARPVSRRGENTTGELANFIRTSGPSGSASVQPSPTQRMPPASRQTSNSSISSAKRRFTAFFNSGIFAKKGGANKAYLDM